MIFKKIVVIGGLSLDKTLGQGDTKKYEDVKRALTFPQSLSGF